MTVLAAFLHPNHVSHSFSDSMQRLIGYDLAHNGRVVRGGQVQFRCGPGGLVEARNQVVEYFLDKSDAEWLWCVDSDMGFAPDTVDRLVAAADPKERPVVGALCFALKEVTPDGMSGSQTQPVPTLYGWAKKPDGEFGYVVQRNYPVNTVVQVAGTGAACLLIHRSIAQRIRELEGPVWFDRVVYSSGTKVSEDLSFCYRVNTAGSPVFVHTGVRTTHHKEFWLGEADYWTRYQAPPATQETAVLVPAKRPINAPVFMESLRASTGLAKAFAVINDSEDDVEEAWRLAGATIITGSATTFAEKVNAGYRLTSEPWVFLAGDDVVFHPAWLDHAQHIATLYDAKVIGTNDLGNPHVVAGEHATHLLISRSYIDEIGASWDGPGVVCHEGYGHWFVDDEIVTAAKQRGVWQMALGSIVEHRHPAWGKAEHDDVYELGNQTAKADKQRFIGRRGSYLHEGVAVGAR